MNHLRFVSSSFPSDCNWNARRRLTRMDRLAHSPGLAQSFCARVLQTAPVLHYLHSSSSSHTSTLRSISIRRSFRRLEEVRWICTGDSPRTYTKEYVESTLNRIILPGAIFLAGFALLYLIINFLGSKANANIQGLAYTFGGTSLLIIVGVALDTLKQIESQLIMRNYDGFMKKGQNQGKIVLCASSSWGPPGAGKGTQAKIICDRYGIPEVSTGEILRAAVKNGTDMGKKAKEYMDAGKLVPDSVVIGIVKDRIREPDAQKGYILVWFSSHSRAGGCAQSDAR